MVARRTALGTVLGLALALSGPWSHACGLSGVVTSFTPEVNPKAPDVRVAFEKACAALREKSFYEQALAKEPSGSDKYQRYSDRLSRANQTLDSAAQDYKKVAGDNFAGNMCRPQKIALMRP